MILSPHIITGAALGANFHNSYLLPLAAIVLHHLLDKIPHYDYQIKPFSSIVALKIFLDISIGTLAVLAMSLFFNPDIDLTYAFIGMFFGTLPDAILLASFIFTGNELLLKYQKFHSFLHSHHKKNMDVEPLERLTPQELFKKRFSWLGIFTQLTVALIAIYFLS